MAKRNQQHGPQRHQGPPAVPQRNASGFDSLGQLSQRESRGIRTSGGNPEAEHCIESPREARIPPGSSGRKRGMNLRLGSQGKPSRQPPLETGTFKRISREAAEEPPVLSNESQAPPVRRGALTLHLPSTSARGDQRKKTDGWRRVGVLSDKQSPTRALAVLAALGVVAHSRQIWLRCHHHPQIRPSHVVMTFFSSILLRVHTTWVRNLATWVRNLAT